ncbi:MAG: class I SAM-dependent methyltransferase [Elusimicrobia bacterium]|nr:class I SAM-dependent methyltransferase [Candidatus Liberimonas magnetica]
MDIINKKMSNSWGTSEASLDQIVTWINGISKSILWKRFLFWKSRLDFSKPARTIELGCGYGKFSMLLGLTGNDVAIFDYNESTIKNAEKAFNLIGLKPNSIVGDLLQIDPSLNEKYDLVCSFGTLEHFSGENRKSAFEANVKLLRKGGILFFSVPNYLGIFYQIPFSIRKLLNLFPEFFYEEAFLHSELANYAKKCNIEILELDCVDTLSKDFNYWILGNIKGFFNKLFKINHKGSNPSTLLKLEKLDFSGDIEDNRNYLDKHFTYNLLFVGRKL